MRRASVLVAVLLPSAVLASACKDEPEPPRVAPETPAPTATSSALAQPTASSVAPASTPMPTASAEEPKTPVELLRERDDKDRATCPDFTSWPLASKAPGWQLLHAAKSLDGLAPLSFDDCAPIRVPGCRATLGADLVDARGAEVRFARMQKGCMLVEAFDAKGKPTAALGLDVPKDDSNGLCRLELEALGGGHWMVGQHCQPADFNWKTMSRTREIAGGEIGGKLEVIGSSEDLEHDALASAHRFAFASFDYRWGAWGEKPRGFDVQYEATPKYDGDAALAQDDLFWRADHKVFWANAQNEVKSLGPNYFGLTAGDHEVAWVVVNTALKPPKESLFAAEIPALGEKIVVRRYTGAPPIVPRVGCGNVVGGGGPALEMVRIRDGARASLKARDCSPNGGLACFGPVDAVSCSAVYVRAARGLLEIPMAAFGAFVPPAEPPVEVDPAHPFDAIEKDAGVDASAPSADAGPTPDAGLAAPLDAGAATKP